MADQLELSPLVAPSPMAEPSEIDLEAGPGDQIQCRICLETDGRDFIAPCKCKGTSKYVHRECLDHWRAIKMVFEEVLEIASHVDLLLPNISLDMWSLWPLLVEALTNWVIDFVPRSWRREEARADGDDWHTDFDPKEKFRTRFPPEGPKSTPPHQTVEFKWNDYRPKN